MLNRRTLLIAAAAAAAAPLAAFLTRPAVAAEPYVFAVDCIAIRGVDPVAYFSQGATVQGSADHALMWDGATWHFSSVANMEMFTANPRAYAPQYGGYCAFAMSKGYIATSVPEAWTIHDQKLYLNFSVDLRQIWSQDILGNIVLADAQWPAILM